MKDRVSYARLYTRIYDILGPKPCSDIPVYQATCGDYYKAQSSNSMILNCCPYVTSEQYNFLNKNCSSKSVVQSCSTLFYDLDDLAKRHSFHCIPGTNASNVNILKVMKISLNSNGFIRNSKGLMQECAPQSHPRKKTHESLVTNSKKKKKAFPDTDIFSSEICLRSDTDCKKQHRQHKNSDRHQKFWSYAKYRTDYTNPISEEKKHKKKDRGKRTEDPCPCQLFSYACPCSDEKSLTELAKKSKSRTVSNQETSTAKMQQNKDEKPSKVNKRKSHGTSNNKENKLLNTEHTKVIKVQTACEAVATTSSILDPIKKFKPKYFKKPRKVKCPKCKENLELLLSTTDDEKAMKYMNSSTQPFHELTSYGNKANSYRQKYVFSRDSCNHEPCCELVPICQVLPTAGYLNYRCSNKQPVQKNSKMIRITKACRHHPPCTVVPSCQRINVLKNNCEFIPPCLHRPRCVNLPLCVPISKTFHIESQENNSEQTEEIDCPHNPKCSFYPECQLEATNTSIGNNQANLISQIHNACDFLNENQRPFVINPKTNCFSNAIYKGNCSFNKTCQFDCTDCNCSATKVESSEEVIYIRDVGCQFRNTNNHNINDVFDYADATCFTDALCSGSSMVSLEVDCNCPTHGDKARQQNKQSGGFGAKLNTSPYVVFVTSQTPAIISPTYATSKLKETIHGSKSSKFESYFGPNSITSRKNLKTSKYKKIFSVKRRKQSKASRLFNSLSSKMPICV